MTGTTERAAEVAVKLDRVRGWLDARGLIAAVFASQPGFAWITAGGDAHVSIGEARGIASAVVTAGGEFVVTTNIERARLVDEELGGLAFEPVDYPWFETGAADRALASLCDPGRSASDIEGPGLPPMDAGLAALRFALLPGEIDRYRALGADAAQAVEVACREARAGDTELDVAGRLADESRCRNILALVNLVAADDRIARYRHPIPTRNRIRGTLLVALTGRRNGLHASLTRMVRFGPEDPELDRRFRAVGRVDAAMILGSRPGATLGEVLATAQDGYTREGFEGEWRLHHQGGLTGYAGREVFGTPGEPHRLQANQAVAWNPSITRVKSEDTVLVTSDGPVVLTRTEAWPQERIEHEAGAIDRPAMLVKGAK